jgi:hypothetical protein
MTNHKIRIAVKDRKERKKNEGIRGVQGTQASDAEARPRVNQVFF